MGYGCKLGEWVWTIFVELCFIVEELLTRMPIDQSADPFILIKWKLKLENHQHCDCAIKHDQEISSTPLHTFFV